MKHLRCVAVAVGAAILGSCARARAVEVMQPQAARIDADLDARRYDAAAAELQQMIDSPPFDNLPAANRYAILCVAGSTQLELRHPARARDFFRRARQIPGQESARDWQGELKSSRRLDDAPAAVAALTRIARRWPDALADVRAETVFGVASDAEQLPDQTARLDLLQALFDARWTYLGEEPSWLWKDLGLMLLDRNQAETASRVATRIRTPTPIVAVLADFRFDPIVRADPVHFDVQRALQEELAHARAAVQSRPRSLRMLHDLASTLHSARRYREELEITGHAVARAEASGDSPYDDTDDQLPWILNAREHALHSLGRWDEAVAELEKASRMREQGSRNVSQSINLAWLLLELDRPEDALAAIRGVTDVSGYGRMQVESVRQRAALEMGDLDAAGKALSFLREHRQDGMGTYQSALVVAHKADEAAALLISRLADLTLRNAALFEVQEFARDGETPREAQWRRLREEMVARPDVQAAIAKVGRVRRYDLQ